MREVVESPSWQMLRTRVSRVLGKEQWLALLNQGGWAGSSPQCQPQLFCGSELYRLAGEHFLFYLQIVQKKDLVEAFTVV